MSRNYLAPEEKQFGSDTGETLVQTGMNIAAIVPMIASVRQTRARIARLGVSVEPGAWLPLEAVSKRVYSILTSLAEQATAEGIPTESLDRLLVAIRSPTSVVSDEIVEQAKVVLEQLERKLKSSANGTGGRGNKARKTGPKGGRPLSKHDKEALRLRVLGRKPADIDRQMIDVRAMHLEGKHAKPWAIGCTSALFRLEEAKRYMTELRRNCRE